MQKLDQIKVLHTADIRSAIRQMDQGGIGIISIVDAEQNVIGVVTDGDFRRAVLKGISLEERISSISNPNFYYLPENYSREDAFRLFQKSGVRQLLVLQGRRLVDVILKHQLYERETSTEPARQIDLPVLIMAGGRGTRLEPFTNILPKPLIPIGNKTILELIMDEYGKYGMKNFYLSLNYKAKIIKAYLEDTPRPYQVQYLEEDKPLGTAGALKYLEGKVYSTFFVSNCDILVKHDYVNIYLFHQKSNFVLTLVACMQHHTIPYGVCEIDSEGQLKTIREKPQYDVLVNTGMYILEPHLLHLIPTGKFYNMTDLIQAVQKQGLPVGVYPVSEKSWIDIGQWEEYRNVMSTIKL